MITPTCSSVARMTSDRSWSTRFCRKYHHSPQCRAWSGRWGMIVSVFFRPVNQHSFLTRVRHHVSVLWGVNSQEREEKVHSFAPRRDGTRLVTSHPQSCYSRISTDSWFSNLGQRLDLAHPHIWICSVTAWGNLRVSSWVASWWLPFISLTPSLLLRTITSIWHNLRVQHNFYLSAFRKVKAMLSLWLSKFSLNLRMENWC